MKKLIFAVATVFVSVSLGAAPVSAASSGSSYVESQIRYALSAIPGGERTAYDTVEWERGDVVLTVSNSPASKAVGTCATGAFCAFSGFSLAGSRLSFTTCTTHSTAQLSAVHSIANAKAANDVQARNSSSTVLVTLDPASQVNTAPAGVSQLRCVP